MFSKAPSRRSAWLVLGLILTLLFPALPQPTAPAGAAARSSPARWTVMIYMVADNNLEDAGIDDFLEMAVAGSNEDLNILVQFDRISGYDNRYGDWTSTKRFRVTAGMTPTAENALMDIGEANMGHPQTAVDFVNWARQNYPADHYALVFWNHGGGWLDAFATRRTGVEDFCWDDTDGDFLTSAELYQIMDSVTAHGASPIDLVGFDACLMGMWEVDNQLQPFAAVSVSSEETEPWDGWPYHTILSDLKASPGWTPQEWGADIVQRYYESYGNSETQSAKDLGPAYDALNQAVDHLAMVLIVGESLYHNAYDQARNAAQYFSSPDFIDLYDFAQEVYQRVPDLGVRAAAEVVMAAVEGAVLLERHGPYWPGAHGIDFYFPNNLGNWSAYQALRSSQLTYWDEFVQHHLGGNAPLGRIAGQVTRAQDGEPLAGATVTATAAGHAGLSTLSGTDGSYGLFLPVDHYDLQAEKHGYITQVITDVVVLDGLTTTADLSLTAVPIIIVQPPALQSSLYPDQSTAQTLWITNSGEAELTFSIHEATRTLALPGGLLERPRAEPVVDAAAWAQVQAAGQARVLIYLRELADLSPAYGLGDWATRGEFVYRRLQETAERSGGGLRDYLEQAGAEPRVLLAANAIAATVDASLLQEIAARPEVAAIGPNGSVAVAPLTPAQAAAAVEAVEWNIQKIRADEVWAVLGITGTGATIGIVDTGVAYTHPALVKQYRGNLGGGSYDHNHNWFDYTGTYPSQPGDGQGHGTFVIGIAVGDDGGSNQIGVAPGARWIAYKAFTDGGMATEEALHAALDWMLAPTDLGGGDPRPDLRPPIGLNPWGEWDSCSGEFLPDIMAWQAAGMLPVFALAGNGPACNSVRSPGDLGQTFTGGATDAADVIAPFSPRGPGCYGVIKPDVSAPGVNVRSSQPGGGYAVWSGTSIAIPHLAGVAALVSSADPSLGMEQVWSIITATALCIEDLSCGGTPCPDGANNVYGWGRLDAFQAVSLALGGLAVDIPWLSEAPTAGTLAPGQGLSITVTFDTSGLAVGLYRAALEVENNDPDNPLVRLPVTLTVQPCDAVVADFLWAPLTPTAGQPVTFTAVASGTPPIAYVWDLGDGTAASGQVISHTYLVPGPYTVVLTATNCGTATFVVAHALTVTPACEPVQQAGFDWQPRVPMVSQPVTFTAWAGGWLTETVDGVEHAGSMSSLALDAAGRPHIAYYARSGLYYAYHDGTAWQVGRVDGLPDEETGWYPSLALDASGHPHVTYFESVTGHSAGDLRYAYHDGTSWHLETVDSAGDVGRWSSLALDAAGLPHVSYYDATAQSLKYARYDGTAWMSETVSAAVDVGTSLALDTSGWPHIAFNSGGRLLYASHDGADWQIGVVDGVPGDETGWYPSLRLDAADRPHISYYEYATGHSATDLKYARYDGAAWHIETVDDEGDVGAMSSLALDAAGRPHVAYAAGWPFGDLRYVWYDGLAWRIQTVDSAGLVGLTMSLALDGEDRPHVSYYDATHQDLRYAWQEDEPTPPLTYTWDLGDGTRATGGVVGHAYTAAATYTVRLTATNCGGALAVATSTLVVLPCTPQASFSWEPLTPTAGLPVTFTALSTGLPPFTFTWDFGDGTAGSGSVALHTYAAAGAYTVVVTASNGCGQDHARAVLAVRPQEQVSYLLYLPLVLKGW